jgi:hypothetical protein
VNGGSEVCVSLDTVWKELHTLKSLALLQHVLKFVQICLPLENVNI